MEYASHQFYIAYSKSETLSRKSGKLDVRLIWSHYLKLVRIKVVADNFMKLNLIKN